MSDLVLRRPDLPVRYISRGTATRKFVTFTLSGVGALVLGSIAAGYGGIVALPDVLLAGTPFELVPWVVGIELMVKRWSRASRVFKQYDASQRDEEAQDRIRLEFASSADRDSLLMEAAANNASPLALPVPTPTHAATSGLSTPKSRSMLRALIRHHDHHKLTSPSHPSASEIEAMADMLAIVSKERSLVKRMQLEASSIRALSENVEAHADNAANRFYSDAVWSSDVEVVVSTAHEALGSLRLFGASYEVEAAALDAYMDRLYAECGSMFVSKKFVLSEFSSRAFGSHRSPLQAANEAIEVWAQQPNTTRLSDMERGIVLSNAKAAAFGFDAELHRLTEVRPHKTLKTRLLGGPLIDNEFETAIGKHINAMNQQANKTSQKAEFWQHLAKSAQRIVDCDDARTALGPAKAESYAAWQRFTEGPASAEFKKALGDLPPMAHQSFNTYFSDIANQAAELAHSQTRDLQSDPTLGIQFTI